MKHARSLFLLAPVLLTACSSNIPGGSTSLEENLRNPLFAQRYYTDLAEQMVTLELREDPLLKDSAKKAIIERTRVDATNKAEAAISLNAISDKGYIISDRDLSLGSVSIIDGALFFSPDFISTPGPSLRVYLSNVIDPRQGAFPDSDAVDLGLLKSTAGAQTFVIPEEKATQTYQTVVLWDTDLEIVYGFVQLENDI